MVRLFHAITNLWHYAVHELKDKTGKYSRSHTGPYSHRAQYQCESSFTHRPSNTHRISMSTEGERSALFTQSSVAASDWQPPWKQGRFGAAARFVRRTVQNVTRCETPAGLLLHLSTVTPLCPNIPHLRTHWNCRIWSPFSYHKNLLFGNLHQFVILKERVAGLSSGNNKVCNPW